MDRQKKPQAGKVRVVRGSESANGLHLYWTYKLVSGLVLSFFVVFFAVGIFLYVTGVYLASAITGRQILAIGPVNAIMATIVLVSFGLAIGITTRILRWRRQRADSTTR